MRTNKNKKHNRRRSYQKPKIIYSKEIEGLAAACPSDYAPYGSCQTEGVCEIAWE